MDLIIKLQRYNRKILLIFAWISLISFLYSIYVVRFSDKDNFWSLLPSWLTWLNGAFIIGDMLILSLFFFIAALILFYVNDVRYTFLTYLVFMLVRNAGEIVYWLNYQFASTHPHPVRNQFAFLTGELKEDHIYILYQLMNQVWVVVWIILLVVLFKNWDKLRR